MEAFISIEQIAGSWRLNNGYPIHYHIEALLLAAKGLQKLVRNASVPMVNHTLLTKAAGQNHFVLPDGFQDLVRVGVRYGDIWWPLPIADRLMPYPNSTGQGDMDPAEFGDDFNTAGDYQSWYSAATIPASFSGDDFAPADFKTTATGGGASVTAPLNSGWYLGDYGMGYGPVWNARWYGVSVDAAHRLLLMPEGFGYEEVYLQYVGVGSIDNMTQIPAKAQEAIEAYIDWKYRDKKRATGRGESQDWERKFYNAVRDLRASYSDLDLEAINRIFGPMGCYGRIFETAR